MNEMNTKWQKIYRTDYVQEYFWPGEFIQSDRWLESSPPEFIPNLYPYLKDGFGYRGSMYTFDNEEIHLTEMIHATSLEHMLSIINEGGFTSQEKYCPGIGPMSLVWFGLKIAEKEINYLREHSKRIVQSQMRDKFSPKADVVLSKIANSPAFQPMSLYGHFKFTIGIQEVLDAYATQFCASLNYPEMRKLGTFAYKQETMHVILVCPPDTSGIDNCPLLSDDPVIQPGAMSGTWTWNPHSTGNEYISFRNSGYPFRNNKRWEHVAFAFNVPTGFCLQIPNLERRVSLCVKRSKDGIISGVNEGITNVLDFIAWEATEKKSLADTLISMIAGYLKEERLYKKTMGDYDMFDEYVRVDLEEVVQRLRDIPSLEFEMLNWLPLIEWVNSLTRHKNVLHDIQKSTIGL